MSQNPILEFREAVTRVGHCSPDSPNLGRGRDLASPRAPLGGIKIRTFGEGAVAAFSLSSTGGIGRRSISWQAWVFSSSLYPQL